MSGHPLLVAAGGVAVPSLMHHAPEPAPNDGGPSDVLARLLHATTDLPAHELGRAAEVAGALLGAVSTRLWIADYGLTSLRELGRHGPTGVTSPIEGTLAGRAFARGSVFASAGHPTTVWVPLAEGSERLGVLELTHPDWTAEAQADLAAVVRVLVLVLISKRRFTDLVVRARRSETLSLAAEIQWSLLPPLTYSSDTVSVSGILEPAYSIGGDSFDFAANPGRLEFAIIDACGHGTPAVMLTVAAINGLRNARREQLGPEAAYIGTGAAIRDQFRDHQFVTGQIGALEVSTGLLTWLNAGHPLPLLVRDGSYTGELPCRPSIPMGLGGTPTEVARTRLQPGDRLLFYTDGVVETRSADGQQFGVPRLADFLVRSTLDRVSPAETVRLLSSSIMAFNSDRLVDDATLLLIEYHGPG